MKGKTSDIQAIDLFAGAGGLGIGAVHAGVNLNASVEIDSWCCKTLRKNMDEKHRHEVIEGDISFLPTAELLERASVDQGKPLIIIGGAPCQPFSKAAYWTDPGVDSRYRRAKAQGKAELIRPAPITVPKSDDRRSLLGEYYRVVRESQADGFVFENVPSILHPRNKSTAEDFVKTLRDEGFHVAVCKVTATQYGVPQARERVFILGARREVPGVPVPTHSKTTKRELHRLPAITCGKALAGFDAEEHFEPEEVIKGRWAEQFFEVPPGMNYKALTAWAGHPNPVFVAETRFWSFLLKLSPDAPSWTLAASPGPWTGPFHWDNRRLRTVEMAALQTFPKDYAFEGSRRERVRQIGNAVPVKLAEAMVSAVMAAVGAEATVETSHDLRIAV